MVLWCLQGRAGTSSLGVCLPYTGACAHNAARRRSRAGAKGGGAGQEQAHARRAGCRSPGAGTADPAWSLTGESLFAEAGGAAQAGRHAEALSALGEAVRLKRDSWQTWSNYAQAAASAGQPLQAARGAIQVRACLMAPTVHGRPERLLYVSALLHDELLIRTPPHYAGQQQLRMQSRAGSPTLCIGRPAAKLDTSCCGSHPDASGAQACCMHGFDSAARRVTLRRRMGASR